MDNLLAKLVKEIQAGQVEDANRTLHLLSVEFRNPANCDRNALIALEKARTLALIQRSHIQRRLRTAAASRLYAIQADGHLNTWRIDG